MSACESSARRAFSSNTRAAELFPTWRAVINSSTPYTYFGERDGLWAGRARVMAGKQRGRAPICQVDSSLTIESVGSNWLAGRTKPERERRRDVPPNRRCSFRRSARLRHRLRQVFTSPIPKTIPSSVGRCRYARLGCYLNNATANRGPGLGQISWWGSHEKQS